MKQINSNLINLVKQMLDAQVGENHKEVARLEKLAIDEIIKTVFKRSVYENDPAIQAAARNFLQTCQHFFTY